MNKYSTCIIGCGNVAGMYGGMNNSRPQTHASTYINNPNTEIIAVVEPDENKAMVFCEKWNIDQHFSSIDLMLNAVSPEIVSICSPTINHFSDINMVCKSDALGIFIEKPLSNKIDECKEIVTLSKDLAVAVNYFRRWNKDIQAIKSRIADNEFGEIRQITIQYTKGMKNNGSHMVDLLLWIFDEMTFESKTKEYEKVDEDQGVDCCFRLSNSAQVNFIHIPNVDYVFIEVDMLFDDFLIRLSQRGQFIQIYEKTLDEDYKVFNKLELSYEKETNWNDCFSNAIDNLIGNIEGTEEILCSADDALKTSLICDEVISSKT